MIGLSRSTLSRVAIAAWLFAVLLMAAPSALAFDVRNGDAVVVRTGETVTDDLYVVAETVTIDGTIRGDAIVAARRIQVNGTIEGSLIAAAQTIIIDGTVRDTARVVAQAVQLGDRGKVGRDLLFAGYSLEASQGSAVGRDAGLAGYQALLAGSIDRNVAGALERIRLSGRVGGDVNVEIGEVEGKDSPGSFAPPPEVGVPRVPPGLTVDDSASIAGRLTYTSELQFPVRGRVAGGVTFNPRIQSDADPAQPTAASRIADAARHLAGLIIAGLLLMWLVPSWMERLAAIEESKPIHSLGWGALALGVAIGGAIGLVMATILLAGFFGVFSLPALSGLVILLGIIAEAILGAGMAIFMGYIAQVIIGFLVGRRLLQRFQPAWAPVRGAPLALGLLVLVALMAIPGVGGLVGFLVALLGLGAAWIWIGERGEPKVPTDSLLGTAPTRGVAGARLPWAGPDGV